MKKQIPILCSSCGLIKKTYGELYPMIPLTSTKQILRKQGLPENTDVYALLCKECSKMLRKKQ